METRIHVREIMTRDVVSVDVGTGLVEAAVKMAETGVGSVIVTEGERPVGIITESDIVRKIVSKGIHPGSVKLQDVMSSPLITVSAQMDVSRAMQLMLKMQVRRLGVVSEGRLVGIVTDMDLISISVELGNVFAELVERHRQRVPPEPPRVMQGICEDCGMFTEDLVVKNGMLLCESCEQEL